MNFLNIRVFLSFQHIAPALGSSSKPHQKSRVSWCVRLNFGKDEKGHFHNLFRTTRTSDPEQFFRYTRMTQNNFHKLCNLIRHRLIKKSNRPVLNPEQRLALTLSA
ncbi:hypothetical protein ABEB36_010754 [Hypothenemus hampei]|uniref:Uncharacterized protein n=1 Tax=Hypothenemus hampei TaxID=57062 RepID=A0ABD1EDP3_HYPHA